MNYLEYAIKYLKESEYISSIRDIVDKLNSSGVPSNNQSLFYSNSEKIQSLTVKLPTEYGPNKTKVENILNIDFKNSDIYSFFYNLSDILGSSKESEFLNRITTISSSLLSRDKVLRSFISMSNSSKMVLDITDTTNESKQNIDSISKLCSDTNILADNYLEKLQNYVKNLNLSSNTGYQAGRTQSTEDEKVDLNVLLNYSEIFIALQNIIEVSKTFVVQVIYNKFYKGASANIKYEEALNVFDIPNDMRLPLIRLKSSFEAEYRSTWMVSDIYSNIEVYFKQYKNDIVDFMDSQVFKKPISEKLFAKEEIEAKENYGDNTTGYAKVFIGKINLVELIKKSLICDGDYNTVVSYSNRFSNNIFSVSENIDLDNGKLTDEQKLELMNMAQSSSKLSNNELSVFKECLDDLIISNSPEIYNEVRHSQSFQLLCFYLRCILNPSNYFSVSELSTYLDSDEIIKINDRSFNSVKLKDLSSRDIESLYLDNSEYIKDRPKLEEIFMISSKKEFRNTERNLNSEKPNVNLLNNFLTADNSTSVSELSNSLNIYLLGSKNKQNSLTAYKTNKAKEASDIGLDPYKSFDYNINAFENMEYSDENDGLNKSSGLSQALFHPGTVEKTTKDGRKIKVAYERLDKRINNSKFYSWLAKNKNSSQVLNDTFMFLHNLVTQFEESIKTKNWNSFKELEKNKTNINNLISSIYTYSDSTESSSINESLYTTYKNNLLKLLRK